MGVLEEGRGTWSEGSRLDDAVERVRHAERGAHPRAARSEDAGVGADESTRSPDRLMHRALCVEHASDGGAIVSAGSSAHEALCRRTRRRGSTRSQGCPSVQNDDATPRCAVGEIRLTSSVDFPEPVAPICAVVMDQRSGTVSATRPTVLCVSKRLRRKTDAARWAARAEGGVGHWGRLGGGLELITGRRRVRSWCYCCR